MRAVAATQDELRWLESRTGGVLTRGARGIAARDSEGRTRGVVAYDNWTDSAAQCHWALDTPVALRALLPAIFSYPFEASGKLLLLGVVPELNYPSIHLAKRLGMRETHRVRDGWAMGQDLVCLELRREDCRYINRKAA